MGKLRLRGLDIFSRAALAAVISVAGFCGTVEAAPGQSGIHVLHNFVSPYGYRPSMTPVTAPDGSVYVTSTKGGVWNNGVVSRVSPSGVPVALKSFRAPLNSDGTLNIDGGAPNNVSVASDSTVYGSTTIGIVYKISPAGVYSVIADTHKALAYGLTRAYDGTLYAAAGTVSSYPDYGGPMQILRVTPTSTAVIASASNLGGMPVAAPDGSLYLIATGMNGSSSNFTNIFRVAPDASVSIVATGSSSWQPRGSLTVGPDGILYGVTVVGGDNQSGTVFRASTSGVVTTLCSMPSNTPSNLGVAVAADGSVFGSINKLYSQQIFKVTQDGQLSVYGSASSSHGAFSAAAPPAVASDGTVYATGIYSYSPRPNGGVYKLTPDGNVSDFYSFYDEASYPVGMLAQASDGSLYGTASSGGVYASGAVFKWSPDGQLRVLHDFNENVDGEPHGDVVQGIDGGLYGITSFPSTILRISPSDEVSTFYQLSSHDGTNPLGELHVGADGSIYGATAYGGSLSANGFGGGTVFKISPVGQFSVLLNIDPNVSASPNGGVQPAADGSLYGVTYNSVYRIAPAGSFSALHAFNQNGLSPKGAPAQAADGSLYGGLFASGGGGIYRIAVNGDYSVAFNFSAATGYEVSAPLTLASDGTIYGATQHGGANGDGTVFRYVPGGEFSAIASFSSATTGSLVGGRLLLGSDGLLYGTASSGGAAGLGTIFRLEPPPAAPQNLRATPGNFSVNLNWDAVAGATGYRVYYATIPGGQDPATSLLVSGPARTVSGLNAGTTYYFRVTALDANNGESAWSGEVSTTTPGQAPQLSFSATPASINVDASSTLNWTSSNVSSCTASGSWSGSEPVSGSQVIAAPPGNGNHLYTLSCTGSSGTVSASANLEVYDVNPDAFSFAPVSGVALDNDIQSATVTISGISRDAPISVSGGDYSINSGAYTRAAGTVPSGSQVKLRVHSSMQFSTASNATLTVGNVSATFTATTLARDITPFAFFFTDVSNVVSGSTQTSNTITVSGINTGAPIMVTGGSYSINGMPFTTVAGTVQDNDQVRVSHVASSQFSTATNTTLTIGADGVLAGVSDTFTSTTQAVDTTPNGFSFASLSNMALNSTPTSEIVTISGINTQVPISVNGGLYSINGSDFTAASGLVKNGDRVRVGVTASGSFNTSTTATLTIGGVSVSFTVTTVPPDATPDAFSFAPVTGAQLGATIISAPVTISGINAPVSTSISGGSYSINNGAFTAAPGQINSSDSVRISVVASSSSNTSKSATLTIGTYSSNFTVTTLVPDTTPDSFTFSPRAGVQPGATATFGPVTISGINTPTSISVNGGSYSVNSGAFTTVSGQVINGDSVSLIIVASSSFGTAQSATLTVGTFSSSTSATTVDVDTVPDAFAFAARTGVARSSVQVSAPITVSGINTQSPVSISGGNGGYSINGGAFTTAPGSVKNGDTVSVKVTASQYFSDIAFTRLNIGGVLADFKVTTLEQDTTPDAPIFPARGNVALGSSQTSDPITVSGINAPSQISVNGGSYSINGGTFTTAGGSVSNGDTVRLGVTASPAFNTTATATLNIGGITAGFNVTTLAADTVPDAFSFSPLSNVTPGSIQISNPIIVSGINTASPISVSGGGSYGINGGGGSATATINNGDTVRVYMIASSAFSAPATATLNIGGVTAAFTVTTVAADTTPDIFGFIATGSALPLSAATSNVVTIAGINTASPVTVSGGEYSINGGAWTSSSGSIFNHNQVQVRNQTALTPGTATKTVLTVGGISATYTSTTIGPALIVKDSQPNAFHFYDQTNVLRGTVYSSNTVTITGLTVPTTFSITGGEYSQDGRIWTTLPGLALNNDTFKVRHTSASTGNTVTSTTLSIGGVTDTFTTTTRP